MMRIENECVCCDLPCINCGRKHVEVYYCDTCQVELDEEKYRYNGYEFCFECFVREVVEDYFRENPTTEDVRKFLIDYYSDRANESYLEDFLNRTGIKYEVVE